MDPEQDIFSDVFAEDDVEVTDLPEQGEEEVVEETPVEEVVEETKPVDMSDAIAKAIAEGFGKIAPKAVEQEAPKMTQEEANRLMNVWDPDEDSVAELTNVLQDPASTVAERKVALAKLRDGLVKQANTFAHMSVQRAVQELRDEFAPVQQVLQQRQQQQIEKDFYGTYPGLKEFKPVVQQVAQAMAAQGYKGANPKDDIAQRTFELIKRVNPNVPDSLLKKTQPSGGTPRPAATHAGKTSGGQGVASATAKSNSASIW